MSNAVAESVISIGAIQEKYLFKKKLGKGGFCDVFLAENRESGEKVAVKMMEMDPAGEKVDRRVARFRREMMLYSQLDHPNIVKVIDSGETETGLLFIVFEYIHGNNLAELLKKEGALSLARTMTLMGQVLSALNEAHTKGIIHRDLKPENIMVSAADGTERIKILDFGISTFISGQFSETPRITKTKEFLGTPSYAAPEQLRGDPVSTKVDIYAWGLLFLECITGKSPFSGTSVAAIVQQQLAYSPVPLPAALVNHRLGTLLRWALEKDADRRAGNASVIASHLEAVSPEGIAQKNGYLTGETMADRANMVQEIAIYETVTSPQERRQVTVVCATLNVQAHQDMESPDVLDEIYQDLMAFGCDIFGKFGAHVVTDTGDRILAFFGYPDASDTDARRAARSALELAMSFERRNTVFSIQHGIQFSYRIGIHTGMVTIRKNIGNKPQLSGLTLNLSGKLCNAADPNSIFLSKSSYLLLKDIVECQEVVPDEVSESFFRDPVFKMIGERRMEGFRGIDTDTISPMVGRDGEMARLHDTWKAAGNEGTGKVMLLQGEAGIGKSRLAAEFAKKVLQANGGWMECRCQPEGKNSALHPIFDYLRNHFGFSRTASPQNNIEALEKHLQSFGIDCSVGMPLFCSWLGLPADGYAMPQFSPQRQKDFILNTSSEILARIVQTSSSVIMIEDLHWADPITLELLPKLFDQVKKRGSLLLMSARPVFIPSWNSIEAEVLTVNPLEDEDIEVIVRNVFGSGEVSRGTIAKIITRVDGVPLFAEEVTRLIREKGVNKGEIPATLRDLLTGKIDQLGPARETVQIASVIGREFDYKLIENLSLKDAASLLADLDQLISAGVMHVQLVVGNPHYMFHHALLRDSAYDSIPFDHKKSLHYKVAVNIEKDYHALTVSQPELLAYHWTIAENYDKASDYGVKAAQMALSRTLNDDAIEFAQNAIELCQDQFKAKERKLILHNILSQAMMLKMGWGNPQITSVLEHAMQLMETVDNLDLKIQTLYGKILYDSVIGLRQKARKAAELLVGLAEESVNKEYLYASLTLLGHISWIDGDYTTSTDVLNRVIQECQSASNLHVAYMFGLHAQVWAMATLADIQWFTCEDDDKILALLDESIILARKLNHIPSLGIALWHKAIIHQYMGNRETIRAVADEVLSLSSNYGLKQYECYMQILLAWVDTNPDIARQALQIGEMIGTKNAMTYYYSVLADIEMERGNFDVALEINNKSIQLCNEMKEHYFESELYRKHAQYLMAKSTGDNHGEIIDALTKSLTIAQELKIKRCESMTQKLLNNYLQRST